VATHREATALAVIIDCAQHARMVNQRSVLFLLGFALSMGSPVAHSELLFRSVETVNGQQRWAPVRSYSNPADLAAAPAGEEVHVFMAGPITAGDLAGARAMVNLVRSGKQKVADNVVWFASDGGDIDAAMEVGRLMRRHGLMSLVGKFDQCLSACVFAFMGGERRSVAGRLGIHRPYFPFTVDTPDRPVRFRNLQRTLRDYVDEMDFPPSLYEALMAVPPEVIHYLSAPDLKRYYLEGISPSSEDLADAAEARRLELSMSEYLQRKAKVLEAKAPLGMKAVNLRGPATPR